MNELFYNLISEIAAGVATTALDNLNNNNDYQSNDYNYNSISSSISSSSSNGNIGNSNNSNSSSIRNNKTIFDVVGGGGGVGLGGGSVVNDVDSNSGNSFIKTTIMAATKILATTTNTTINSDTTIVTTTTIDDLLINWNNETTERSYTPYHLRPETYIVPIIFAIIFIAGVLGNGTLIIVFLRHRAVRNVPNTYILSLAIADLIVILTSVPLTSTVYMVDSWPWGVVMCKLSEFFKDLSIGVSVFTLTALSGDRYFAIVDPLRKFHAHGGGKRATHMTIAIAVSIWILAIICGLPALIASYIREFEINSNKSFIICYPFPEEWGIEYARSMILVRFLIYYAIPLLIIGIFYGLIACHLVYTASVPGEIQGTVRQIKARKKVAVTVLAFVVIFGICFFPSHLFMLWFYYCPTAQKDYNTFWHVLKIVGYCLSFANSCANPVALYFVSGAFRKHFKRYLFCQESKSGRKKYGDQLAHRDASLTSTMSRRFTCRRSYHHHSTIRRLQETTITVVPNGLLNTNEELDCDSDHNI